MENKIILDEKILSRISGGDFEIISSENNISNVGNFWLNLCPGVHRKHIRVKYQIPDDWIEFKDDDSKKFRNITQIAEMNDMSWKQLSKHEKTMVSAIALTAIGLFGTTAIFSTAKLINRFKLKSE